MQCKLFPALLCHKVVHRCVQNMETLMTFYSNLSAEAASKRILELNHNLAIEVVVFFTERGVYNREIR